jgi:AmmeMemoRadiSam system protein B
MPAPLPRLVPVDASVVEGEGGESQVVVKDPMGIAPDALAMPAGAYWLAAQLDGSRTVADLVAQARVAGAELAPEQVTELVGALGEAGFLAGPRREALRRRALAAFRAQRWRAPSCAGGVYPADPTALRGALDRLLAHPRGPGPASRAPTPISLLVAPHVDYPRGAAGYAHAYRALYASDADLFVVFGTAHASPPHLFTLTRLDHGTPLGPVRTDRPAVEALAAALGEAELFDDELAHRDEHSVELQLVLLAHVVRRPFTVLPVLCSSTSHLADPAAATAPFLDALRRVVTGRRVCYVAGADLAHVGPMYGDAAPPTPAELAGLAAADRRTLAFAAAGDARGFHRDAVRDDTRRRLCGVAPIYAALRASDARARLLHYEQWWDGTDSVSFAAAAG